MEIQQYRNISIYHDLNSINYDTYYFICFIIYKISKFKNIIYLFFKKKERDEGESIKFRHQRSFL
jgi:hypothetical protein